MVSNEYKYALTKLVKSYKVLLDACDNKDAEHIPSLVSDFNQWKEELISEKERHGFTPDIAFLNDQSYIGFRIANGRIIGDQVEAYISASKWAEQFNAGASAEIFYDLSVFIFFNVDYTYVEEQLKERRINIA